MIANDNKIYRTNSFPFLLASQLWSWFPQKKFVLVLGDMILDCSARILLDVILQILNYFLIKWPEKLNPSKKKPEYLQNFESGRFISNFFFLILKLKQLPKNHKCNQKSAQRIPPSTHVDIYNIRAAKGKLFPPSRVRNLYHHWWWWKRSG